MLRVSLAGAEHVAQTRNELESVERRVASEVRLAEREYQYSKRALERIEKVLWPRPTSATGPSVN